VPRGTGGAIRNVLGALQSGPDDPVLILNGDVLSGHDMAGQVAHHVRNGADATLHLINVDDPRPFGLVPTDVHGRVTAFLEKPETPEEIVTHQINAGCYVFARRVIDAIPAGRPVSVERETFPQLLAANATVLGWVEDAYWLDLGNPLAYAKGSRDVVTGAAPAGALESGPAGAALIIGSAVVDPAATVDGGSCIGEGAVVEAGAMITGSVVMERAHIAAGAVIINSIIGRGTFIGASTSLTGTVVADGARIGSYNELPTGSRVFPGAVIGDTVIRTSPDRA
jgi:mannose-1-phosphate guanylyltransferase